MVSAFKGQAVSIHWEFMFTRSSFQTPDMIAQHHLLNDVADLIDKGVLRTTLDQTLWNDQRGRSARMNCSRQDRAGGVVAAQLAPVRR
jgi:NADPH:quinone reductase-like Zn-dependent oxidoreductase